MPNAKVLESKKAIVDALAEKMQAASAAVFVDYKGITVAQDTELRNKFREAGVEYTVVKNTLTRFAANKVGYTAFDDVLNGTTSMASTTGDPIAPARIVCEFAKKNKLKNLKIKGGFVEGSVMSVEQLNGLANCPRRMRWLPRFSAPCLHLSPAWHLSWTRSGNRRPAALLLQKKLLQKRLNSRISKEQLTGGFYHV